MQKFEVFSLENTKNLCCLLKHLNSKSYNSVMISSFRTVITIYSFVYLQNLFFITLHRKLIMYINIQIKKEDKINFKYDFDITC